MNYIKQLIGLLFAIIGFIGFFFFNHYKGESIPSPNLWYIGSIAVCILGLFLLFHGKNKVVSKLIEAYHEEKRKFKAKAEKRIIDFDDCEFTNTGYTHEVEDDEYSWMAGRVMFTHEITKLETIYQSGLIYYYKTIKGTEKFYSPSFPFDKKTLEFYVLEKKITLYIDRFNRKNYFFEVEN